MVGACLADVAMPCTYVIPAVYLYVCVIGDVIIGVGIVVTRIICAIAVKKKL